MDDISLLLVKLKKLLEAQNLPQGWRDIIKLMIDTSEQFAMVPTRVSHSLERIERKMITRKDAADIMERVFDGCRVLRGEGQKEYAHDDQNALANFERVAADLKLDKKMILWVYTRKHLDGIVAYINGHKSQREDVRGRIKDVIVYLCLLVAMIEEDEKIAELDKRQEEIDKKFVEQSNEQDMRYDAH